MIDLCVKYDKDFNTLRDMCTYLTPFAVQVRYPDNNFDITDVESKKALNYTKIIIDFVADKMKNAI